MTPPPSETLFAVAVFLEMALAVLYFIGSDLEIDRERDGR